MTPPPARSTPPYLYLCRPPSSCFVDRCVLLAMVGNSPDDVFLLTSAVDNEVKQYLAVDGRLHMDLDVPKTGLTENFTRSYYTSSGR